MWHLWSGLPVPLVHIDVAIAHGALGLERAHNLLCLMGRYSPHKCSLIVKLVGWSISWHVNVRPTRQNHLAILWPYLLPNRKILTLVDRHHRYDTSVVQFMVLEVIPDSPWGDWILQCWTQCNFTTKSQWSHFIQAFCLLEYCAGWIVLACCISRLLWVRLVCLSLLDCWFMILYVVCHFIYLPDVGITSH